MSTSQRIAFTLEEQATITSFLESRMVDMERGLAAARVMVQVESTEHTQGQLRHWKAQIGCVRYLLSTVAQSRRRKRPQLTG